MRLASWLFWIIPVLVSVLEHVELPLQLLSEFAACPTTLESPDSTIFPSLLTSLAQNPVSHPLSAEPGSYCYDTNT